MRLVIALLIAGSCWCTPTSAEQKSSEISATAGDFSGAYAGLGLGFALGSGMAEYPILAGGTIYESFDPNTGLGAGAYVGYNFQRGNYVYGAELQYSRLIGVRPSGPSGDPELEEVADLRGRFGYVAGDAMYYGALGWSVGGFHVHPGRFYGSRQHDVMLQGANLSAGVEYNFRTRWFAGGEITYRGLRGRFDEASRDVDLDVVTVGLRLGYRF